MNNKVPAEGTGRESELRGRIAAGSNDPDDYLALADLLSSDARDEDAIHVYEQALDFRLTSTQRATALTKLGGLLDAARGQPDRARALVREALDLLGEEPDTLDVRLIRGLNLARIAIVTWFEDPSEGERIGRQALQALERVIQESDDADATEVAYSEAALLYSSLGDQDRAIALYQRSLESVQNARSRAEVLNLLAEAFRLATFRRKNEGANPFARVGPMVGLM